MAEDSFQRNVVALVLFVLFSILIITVAVDFGAEYGRDSQEIGDGSLNLVEFESVGDSVEGNASAYRESFEAGSVDDVDDASGIFGTAKKVVNLITSPFTLLSQIMVNILHVPAIFVNIVLGLLSIVIILGIWRLLRAGS